MRNILHNGIDIAFDHEGSSAASPVVLLHGLSSSRQSYAALLDHLAERIESGSIQVFNVDLRGHGESGWAALDTYDAASYAHDIAWLIESSMGRPAAVIGHSLGGVVAASLAQSRPELVSSVFLEDPPLFEGDDERRSTSPVAAFFPTVVAGVRALQARNAALDEYRAFLPPDEPDLDARCRTTQMWDPTTMEAACDGIVWRGFDPVAAIAVPVTIVRADPAQGAVFWPTDEELFRRANPHTIVFEVAGASHRVRGSRPAEYHAGIDAFLSS